MEHRPSYTIVSEGTVQLTAEAVGENVVFKVCDTGAGIAETEQVRIFEPFWQSQSGHTRTAGGTGLGLTISRRLTRLMGGEVSVTSVLGEGTTFEVRVPLVVTALDAQTYP